MNRLIVFDFYSQYFNTACRDVLASAHRHTRAIHIYIDVAVCIFEYIKHK